MDILLFVSGVVLGVGFAVLVYEVRTPFQSASAGLPVIDEPVVSEMPPVREPAASAPAAARAEPLSPAPERDQAVALKELTRAVEVAADIRTTAGEMAAASDRMAAAALQMSQTFGELTTSVNGLTEGLGQQAQQTKRIVEHAARSRQRAINVSEAIARKLGVEPEAS